VKKCDADLVTPSDYTIMVEGLKGVKCTKTEIRHFFEKQLDGSRRSLVVKVVFGYEINKLIKMTNQRKILMNKRRKQDKKIEKADQY
jgi:hypothetical protein